MNEQLSATIIPFPSRSRGVAPPASIATGELTGSTISPIAPQPDARELPHTLASSAQRLTYALNGLSTALADQRDATQRWKTALEDLANKMRTLGDTAKFGKNAG